MPHTNARERNRSRATNGTKKFGSKSPSASFSTKSGRSAAVYDDAARHEYLTGFSTRKKAAKLAAQQRALKRAREEKLELRRQLKAARLAKVQENVEEQAEWYGDDAFATVTLDQLIPKRRETYDGGDTKEYDTENQDDEEFPNHKTTVTVEAFSVDHSVLADQTPKASTSKPFDQTPSNSLPQNSIGTKRSSQSSRGKKKVGKIPYESKATRSIDRAKKQRKREEKSSGKSKTRRRTGPIKRG